MLIDWVGVVGWIFCSRSWRQCTSFPSSQNKFLKRWRTTMILFLLGSSKSSLNIFWETRASSTPSLQDWGIKLKCVVVILQDNQEQLVVLDTWVIQVTTKLPSLSLNLKVWFFSLLSCGRGCNWFYIQPHRQVFSTRSNLDPTVSRDIGSDSLRAQPFDDFSVYIFPRPFADAATVNFHGKFTVSRGSQWCNGFYG